MYDIASMSRNELSLLMQQWGEPSYRAAQIFKWVQGGAACFDDMLNIPKALRERLKAECFLTVLIAQKTQTASDGTVKILWRLSDGETVESVFMQYKHGNTVCISTQVGCRMGCAFCASTHGGLVRNLTPAEMLAQVRGSGDEVTGVVLMGIGEPLDNFDNVMRFLELLGEEDGLHIGMRHVSLSTCGFSDGIEKLAEKDLQLTLSVSLHAPDDATRSRIMPVNKSCGVEKLIERCNEYRRKTGRRISYEYIMADGVTDKPEQARLLAQLLKKSDAHVNLIPLNRVDGSVFIPSGREAIASFRSILEKEDVNATVRRRMGADIDAACGQLRTASKNKDI